jgi:hypothetical protein
MKRKFYSLTNKSFASEGVSSYKELWEKVKSQGYTALSLGVEAEFQKSEKEGDEVENKFHAILSTASEDRHGDVVVQEWVLKNYKKNSVVLDSHNYHSIEFIIGRIENLAIEGKGKRGRLEGDVIFAVETARGKLAYDLRVGKFLNTLSVGFIPLDFDDKGRIIKSELLELSAVSVPANPEALFEKAESAENIGGEVENDNGSVEPVSHSPTPLKATGGDENEEIETDTPVGEGDPEPTPERKGVSVMLLERIETEEKSQQNIVRRIAKELNDTKTDNLLEKKRKIFKDLRMLL